MKWLHVLTRSHFRQDELYNSLPQDHDEWRQMFVGRWVFRGRSCSPEAHITCVSGCWNSCKGRTVGGDCCGSATSILIATASKALTFGIFQGEEHAAGMQTRRHSRVPVADDDLFSSL